MGCCSPLPCVGWDWGWGGTNKDAPAWLQDNYDDHWIDRDYELILDAMPGFLAFLRKDWQRVSGVQGSRARVGVRVVLGAGSELG